MSKIVIADNHVLKNPHGLNLEHWQSLGAEVVNGSCDSEQDLVQTCGDADVVVFFGTTLPFTADVLKQLSCCKLILKAAIGYDSVDVAAATELGIMVANCAGYCVEEVATHALSFLLACNHQLPSRDADVRAGRWYVEPKYPTERLSTRTVGVIGLGAIGGTFARKVAPLVKRVLATDPYLSVDDAAKVGAELVPLSELLQQSDFVSVHTPLTTETRRLVGADELAQMKPTAYLINTARGPIVDQEALFCSLRDGRIAGAALDVIEVEPPPQPLHDFFSLPNLMVSPHSAASSPSSLEDLWKIATENVAYVLKGERPATIVNPDVTPRG